jgi:tripartite ATP-independent transporter DctM subunit
VINAGGSGAFPARKSEKVVDWLIALVFIFGGFMVLLATGLPVAFSFMLINMVGVIVYWGGEMGLHQMILSIDSSVSSFTLLPVTMFLLMGEALFHSGMAMKALESLDKWIGRVPGRLSLLAVVGGTLFAALTGVAMGSVAMLGSVLVPEMEKRGYSKSMALGPILGSGALAIMIPPTALGVLLATIAQISIGRLLIAIILPGLLMAACYATYVVVVSIVKPETAPRYEIPSTPLREKVVDFAKYVLPLGIIIFLVIGLMFLGIAGPSEAAATGALGSFVLAAFYRRLTWGVIRKTVTAAFSISAFILMILAGSTAFSQILAFSGATEGFAKMGSTLPVSPILVLLLMQLVLFVLGCFIDQISIMMVTIPIFMPVVKALGWDPVWFGAIVCLNVEMAAITPPFGMALFAMKGVAPEGTTMQDIYSAVTPYVLMNFIVMALMILFPQISLWLPSKMM